ncbi:hypothetical protein NMY22_g15361 [Coprinellus aureogranulatus]|nr:hypothetical protein NMY22_g15361 [Coprinellus aureogranulatus]
MPSRADNVFGHTLRACFQTVIIAPHIQTCLNRRDMASQVYTHTSYYQHRQHYAQSSMSSSGSSHGSFVNGYPDQRHHDSARGLVNDYQPIFILPHEILSQIMSLSLPTLPTLKQVMQLGAVCRQWRSTAWTCTELWSKISLNFQWSEYQRSKPPMNLQDIQILQQWIQRAGPTRALELKIKCTALSLLVTIRKCPFAEPTQLLNFLRYSAHRFEFLDLCMPWTWYAYFRDLQFLQLKSLRMRPFDKDPRPGPFRIKPGFTLSSVASGWAAPALQVVELHGIEVSANTLPWGQLRYIALYDTNAEGVLEVLPFCKNATEIRVTILWGSYHRLKGTPSLLRPVQSDLPLLEHLLLYAEDPGFTVNVLSGLFAPKVQCISTSMYRDRVDGLTAAFKSFVKRCRLRRLVLAVNSDESAIAEWEIMRICEKKLHSDNDDTLEAMPVEPSLHTIPSSCFFCPTLHIIKLSNRIALLVFVLHAFFIAHIYVRATSAIPLSIYLSVSIIGPLSLIISRDGLNMYSAEA